MEMGPRADGVRRGRGRTRPRSPRGRGEGGTLTYAWDALLDEGFGLGLAAVGGDRARTRPRSPRVRVEAERLTYAWDALLDEWFVNGRDGLEHGFTLRNRPAGASGALSFDLSVRGTLRATVDAKGRDVTFVDG